MTDCSTRIRMYTPADFDVVLDVINDGAQAYRNTIPAHLWREPFVSRDYLKSELDHGVIFSVFERANEIVGVMGVERFDEVTLIRHSYVRTNQRRAGIGSKLIKGWLQKENNAPVLVGCLKAMSWAISFYQKHGFVLLSDSDRDALRAKYWRLSQAHVRESVVLANAKWLQINGRAAGKS